MINILKIWISPRIALLMGSLLLLGCPKPPEEKFEDLLPKKLAYAYRRLPQKVRTMTAHRGLSEIAALQRVSWKPSIVALEKDGAVHRPVYELRVGRARLFDCRLSRERSERTGSCSSFSYPASWKEGAPDEQKIPLTLHFSDPPQAQSAKAVPLRLGVAEYSMEGTVRIGSADALVQDVTLLVPHFVTGAPGAFRVPLSDFSLMSSKEILSIGEIEFAEPFPQLSSLETLHGIALTDMFTVRGKLRIDLLSPTQGYQANGAISVLGDSFKGQAEIYPTAYITAALGGLSVPGPIKGMCIPIKDAAVELGLASQTLRVTGTTEIVSPASLLCAKGLPSTLSLSLDMGIGIIRDLYDLPEKLTATTQFVLDKNDQILCADLAVQGRSLFRGAYLGSTGPVIWAPISSTGNGPMLAGDLQLPPSEPGKCWEGDPGSQARRNHPG